MKSRKYVEIIYDNETQLKLRNWCLENGLDLTKTWSQRNQSVQDFEFHTTIMYSKNEIYLENGMRATAPATVTPIQFIILGGFPVLELEYEGALKRIHEHFKSLGLENFYEDYIPHISVSYNGQSADISVLAIPNFSLTFDKLNIEDIMEY